MSEELAPCPFCGEIKTSEIAGHWRTCLKCGIVNKKSAFKNAYCWKKISALESELAACKLQSNSWAEACMVLQKENKKMKRLLKKYQKGEKDDYFRTFAI